jgi:hypothetical protein
MTQPRRRFPGRYLGATAALLALVLALAATGPTPRAEATSCDPEDPSPSPACQSPTTTTTTPSLPSSPDVGPDEVTYTIKDEGGAVVGSGSFLVVADSNHGSQSTADTVSKSVGEGGIATRTSEAVVVDAAAALAVGERCRSVSTVRRHDFLRLGIRLTAFKMQQDFNWCYKGGRVSRVRGHHTFFPYIHPNWHYQGMVTWWLYAASNGSNPRAAYKYGWQGHMKFQFLALSSNYYPWMETRGWYNGAVGISTNLR